MTILCSLAHLVDSCVITALLVVYIVDSGLDTTHPDFINPSHLLSTYSQKDPDGHGTQVAGLVSGNSTGIAPYITTKMVQFRKDSSSKTDDVIKVFSNILSSIKQMHYKKATLLLSANVHLSLAQQEQIHRILKEIYNWGAIIIVPAGSGFLIPCVPSTAPYFIVVASIKQSHALDGAKHPCTSVYALGRELITTKSGGGYVKVSGNEYAAAQVAGVAAAYFSAGRTLNETRQAILLGTFHSPVELKMEQSEEYSAVYLTSTGKMPYLRVENVLDELTNIGTLYNSQLTPQARQGLVPTKNRRAISNTDLLTEFDSEAAYLKSFPSDLIQSNRFDLYKELNSLYCRYECPLKFGFLKEPAKIGQGTSTLQELFLLLHFFILQ
jgi:subtilisin family serine protease